MTPHITASIVLYRNSPDDILKLISSLKEASVKILLIDNSPLPELKDTCFNASSTEYIHTKKNIGYGAGHNIAIKKYLYRSKYHIVLNPDIQINPDSIRDIFNFMEENSDIGLVMPKIIYPDGSLQYLCKLLPEPQDLIFRRFMPFSSFTRRRNQLYELQFTGYHQLMDVPYLSGCFMFFRNAVLQRVGLFDERYFMYLEDVDLSRRIHFASRTVFFPDVSVIHRFEKGSYKHIKLLLYHIKSAIHYFNKWGWFVDKERDITNNNALKNYL